MTVNPDKPTIPQVRDRFAAYLAKNPVWGSLHIVLSDQNIDDGCVRFCIDQALAEGDEEGMHLGGILLRMSRTQRLKLSMLL